MGNRTCKQRPKAQNLDQIFPAQSDFELDWKDEQSILRRTAINCLHNYALGKMEESLVDQSSCASKRRKKTASLKFAELLVRTEVFEWPDIGLVPIDSSKTSTDISIFISQDLP
jgi:hypothetical protein